MKILERWLGLVGLSIPVPRVQYPRERASRVLGPVRPPGSKLARKCSKDVKVRGY